MTKPANPTDTEGAQLRAFVERIMRMREEAKAVNDDIREIYAEAKANGYDKTVLGKVVLYVEKRSKDASAVQESDALFELYLEAFDGGSSRAHAHTCESQPDHDPETGEIIEGDDAERQQRGAKGTTEAEGRAHRVNVAAPAAGHPGAAHSRDADGQQRAADRATDPDNSQTIVEPAQSDPSGVAADRAATVAENVRVAANHIPDAGKMVAADQSTGNVDGSAGRSHSSPKLSTESPASVPVDTNHPQPVDLAGLPEASASGSDSNLQHEAGDRADPDPHSLVGSSNSNLQDDLGDQAGAAAAGLSNTAAAPNKRRPYCRMPGACTGFGDKHCFTCDMRRDSLKPVGLSIGAADIPMMGAVR